MAGLKNFSQWYAPERQAALAGTIMIAGGLGAISASVPLEAMLPTFGWRGIFMLLTGGILAVTAFLFFTARDHQHGIERARLAEQWRGVVRIFGNRNFWRFAPQTAFFSGGFMAVVGLWAVPWLITVDGRSRSEAAATLLAISLGMLASYTVSALFASRLIRAGVHAATMLGAFTSAGFAFQVLIVLDVLPALPLWVGYGFCTSATQFAYTAVTQRFPLALSGRVSTALNLMAFVGAFGLQWGIGVVIDRLTALGWTAPAAYRAAFAMMAALQFVGLLWFFLEGRRDQRLRSRALVPPPAP